MAICNCVLDTNSFYATVKCVQRGAALSQSCVGIIPTNNKESVIVFSDLLGLHIVALEVLP